jgi:hypothetical protein
MRFGSSTLEVAPHATVGLRLQARCLSAYQAGHGVVRIPHTSIAPLDVATSMAIRHTLTQHQLRCVIHAPIVPPHTIVPQLTAYADFLNQVNADDGVIICHMTAASAHEWLAVQSLPASIRTYLAIEVTNQPIDDLCASGIPIIFDWLHYQLQSPWPYQPLMAAIQCHHTWGTRRPLIHLSSLDTAEYGDRHKHIHGRHSAYLDWATLMHFVGQLSAHVGDRFDIEVEASAGAQAVAHFLQQCQRHTPPHWQHLWHTQCEGVCQCIK